MRYHILFNGDVAEGQDPQTVADRLGRLLKMDPAGRQRLFSGRTVVVRRNVDAAAARRYQQLFAKAGARCRLQPAPAATDPAEAAPPGDGDGAQMDCPHCGWRQPRCPECAKCGIVIAKYRPGREGAAKPANSSAAAAESRRPAHAVRRILADSGLPLRQRLERLYALLFMHIRGYVDYGQKVADVLTRALLLLLFATLAATAVLFVAKMMWAFYIETLVGRKFIADNPLQARSIAGVMGHIAPLFVARITAAAMAVCLTAAAVCRFFFIARYVYDPRGLLGKLFVWGLPLSALVARVYQRMLSVDSWALTWLLAAVPTLCVFGPCFKFAQELVPELGDVVRTVFRWTRRLLQWVYLKAAAASKDRP